MADKEQTNVGQINGSPLFDKIPVELRLQIYEDVFEGSKTTYKQSHVIGHRTYHRILLPTNHHNLVLTCRQAYNESQQTYWKKTILYGDYDSVEAVFFLRSVVPDFAKPHIQHIRGLSATCLRAHSVRACLQAFQSLQTIGFEYVWTFNMTGWDNPPTIQEQAEDHFKWSAWKFDGLIYDGGPAVICGVLFRLAKFEGSRLVAGGSEQDRKVKI